MKVVSKILFLLSTITLCTRLVMAQENLLVSRTSLYKSNKKIIETFLNENSGDFLRLFEEESRQVKIQTGNYAGFNYLEAIQGIILPDGSEFMFRRNEVIIANENNFFLTRISDYEGNKSEFISYAFTDKSFQKVGNMEHSSLELSEYLMDNGLIIITDESEGFGTFVELYNNRFEDLNSYIPFREGYSEALFAYSDKLIVGIFRSAGNEIVKMVFFNPLTGKLETEKIIVLSSSLQLLQATNAYFLVYGSGTLKCFNLNGEILWDKQFVLPNFDIYNNGESVFLFTTTELVSISLTSGVVNWQLDLKELSGNSSMLSDTQTIRPTAVSVESNFIDIIFSLTRKGSIAYSDKKLNNQFVRINVNGDIQIRILLSQEANDLKIDQSKEGITIIQDQEILKVEL